MHRLSIVLVALSLAACQTSHGVRKPPKLPPPVTPVKKVVSEQTLFREASRAFRAGDYLTSYRKYARLLKAFPNGDYGDVSRFNAGLSLERAKRYREAIPYFRALLRRGPGSKDAHDALFHIATCQERLRQWKDAQETLTRVLKPEYPAIVPIDRLEAHARRGYTFQKRADFARAERDYRRVFRILRRNMHNPYIRRSVHVSMAEYQMGQIYASLFRTIKFKLPPSRMARDLEDKSNYFLKAQRHYLGAVRRHHPKYAVAAGYQLGLLYERFYRDLMAAEIPKGLGADGLKIYFDELKKKIHPLIDKAERVYRKSLELASRLGETEARWIRKTRAKLTRLKKLIAKDFPKSPAKAKKRTKPKKSMRKKSMRKKSKRRR